MKIVLTLFWLASLAAFANVQQPDEKLRELERKLDQAASHIMHAGRIEQVGLVETLRTQKEWRPCAAKLVASGEHVTNHHSLSSGFTYRTNSSGSNGYLLCSLILYSLACGPIKAIARIYTYAQGEAADSYLGQCSLQRNAFVLAGVQPQLCFE